MKVSVDTSACMGHSLCHIDAPHVFGLDDVDGFSVVLLPDGDVPPELARTVRTAASGCPERAILIED
jgi:ferredoxin